MKKLHVLVTGFLALVFVLSPVQTLAQIDTKETAYRATLFQLIQLLQKQIITLQSELDRQLALVELTHEEMGKLTESVQPVAIYDINSPVDVNLIRNREYQKYFARVFDLFPSEYDEKVVRLLIYDGEDTAFDAYVETIPPAHSHWLYAAREAIVNDADSVQSAELIVHELGHIISYEEILGLPKPAITNCESYFSVHGCPAENSYLRQFVDSFWTASDLKRAERFAKAGDDFESAYVYYDSHKNNFVTNYAASSPEEDFADSFMFYVMGEPVKGGSTARQKVDFFKRYPHFVSVREEILSNL